MGEEKDNSSDTDDYALHPRPFVVVTWTWSHVL